MQTGCPVLAPRTFRTAAATAVCLALAGLPGLVSAQTWNAGTASWFDALNWTPQFVPVAGDAVLVSNGGKALLAGVASTPVLGSLTIGLSGAGTGTGAVTSSGVALHTSGAINVGTGFAAGSFADGVLGIEGAGARAGSVAIGLLASPAVAASARGSVAVGQSLLVNNGLLQVGQMFLAPTGSTANGALSVGGDGGTVSGFLIAGNVSSNFDNQIGNQSIGTIAFGGDLALGGGTTTVIGTTFGPDRSQDGTRINRASGLVTVGGTLTLGPSVSMTIGQTGNGVVDGSLSAGTLSQGANALNGLQMGVSIAGDAQGSFSASAGDLRVQNNVLVGSTNAGRGVGRLELGGGGRLLGGGNGTLFSGVSFAAEDALVQANGQILASGGVEGYSGYQVGVLGGKVAAGSVVSGTLIGGANAAPSATGAITVGTFFGSGDPASGSGSVSGTMTVGQSLLVNNNVVQVGQMFGAAAGSTANGSLSIGGDGGTVSGFLIVGNVSSTFDQLIGNQSSGAMAVGGNLALGGGTTTVIGTTFGPDRSQDGTRVNRASGLVTVGGTLTLGPLQTMAIGQTGNGIVDGTLSAAVVEMAGARLNSLVIGSSQAGQASGRFEIRGGSLDAGTLFLGLSSSGTAQGTLALSNADFSAQQVVAGTGGGRGELLLSEATAQVSETFQLLDGLLSLDRSLLEVGDLLTLGEQARLHIDIDGLLRGSEFGAIDALFAALAGALTVDFSELAFSGGSMVFDLLRSGSGNGIAGDFNSFSFTGLQAGYSVTAGTEFDGVEVYRLRLTRNDVPEPGGAGLVLLALALLAARRARRSRRAG